MLNRLYFTKVYTKTEGDYSYTCCRPKYSPMVLVSESTNTPLASLHLLCQDYEKQNDDLQNRGRAIITERADDMNDNCQFQGLVNRDNQEIEFVITNLSDLGHINYNILKNETERLNQINVLKPNECVVVKSDKSTNKSLVLKSIVDSAGDSVTLESDESSSSKNKGTYYNISIVPEKSQKELCRLYENTKWVVPEFLVFRKTQFTGTISIGEPWGYDGPHSTTQTLEWRYDDSFSKSITLESYTPESSKSITLESYTPESSKSITLESYTPESSKSITLESYTPESLIIPSNVVEGQVLTVDNLLVGQNTPVNSTNLTWATDSSFQRRSNGLTGTNSALVLCGGQGISSNNDEEFEVLTLENSNDGFSMFDTVDREKGMNNKILTSKAAKVEEGRNVNVRSTASTIDFAYHLHSPKVVLGLSVQEDIEFTPELEMDKLRELAREEIKKLQTLLNPNNNQMSSV